jgi:hypothetical protein
MRLLKCGQGRSLTAAVDGPFDRPRDHLWPVRGLLPLHSGWSNLTRRTLMALFLLLTDYPYRQKKPGIPPGYNLIAAYVSTLFAS